MVQHKVFTWIWKQTLDYKLIELFDTQVSSNISSFRNENVSMHSGWPLDTSVELTNMPTLPWEYLEMKNKQ